MLTDEAIDEKTDCDYVENEEVENVLSVFLEEGGHSVPFLLEVTFFHLECWFDVKTCHPKKLQEPAQVGLCFESNKSRFFLLPCYVC